MINNITAISLSLITCLILSSCDPTSTRMCAVFSHPEFSSWNKDVEGIVQFGSADGQTVEFTSSRTILNEPYTGSGVSSKSSDVVCNLTATVEYDSDALGISLLQVYTQYETVQQEPENEVLAIVSSLKKPTGERLTGRFVAGLSGENHRSNPPREGIVSYIDSIEIGGQVYQDVVQIDAVDFNKDGLDIPDASINVIKQLVYAKSVGLLSFTAASDISYVRVIN